LLDEAGDHENSALARGLLNDDGEMQETGNRPRVTLIGGGTGSPSPGEIAAPLRSVLSRKERCP